MGLDSSGDGSELLPDTPKEPKKGSECGGGMSSSRLYAMSKWLSGTDGWWPVSGDADWLVCPVISYGDGHCMLVLAGGVGSCWAAVTAEAEPD